MYAEDIFRNHKDILRDFLERFLGMETGNDVNIARGKKYQGKGSIDLFVSFETKGVTYHVLIEVKVHDFLSATAGQIKTYFNAALEELPRGHVYFIYLTQFNRKNAGSMTNIPTLDEFDKAQHEFRKYSNNFLHVNWEEFHFAHEVKESFNRPDVAGSDRNTQCNVSFCSVTI